MPVGTEEPHHLRSAPPFSAGGLVPLCREEAGELVVGVLTQAKGLQH